MSEFKSAFICPLYDKENHFELALNLLKSKVDLDIETDLFFIFSNTWQKDKFVEMAKNIGLDVLFIVVPDELGRYKSQVTLKKFYALQQIGSKYDYIATLDSETKFIKNGNYGSLLHEIFEKETMLNANVSYDGFFILRKCFLTLGLYFNKKLRRETENFKYNIWFNELQVYKCTTLPSFFKWLEQFDKEKYLNEWLCFEYYIYVAYLILEENYHIHKFPEFSSMGGIMEYLPFFSCEKQEEILYKFGTHWSSNPKVLNPNVHLLFHLDRVNGDGYSYKNFDEKHIKMNIVTRKKFLLRDRLFHTLGITLK